MPSPDRDDLTAALAQLADTAVATRLELELPGVAAQRADRDELTDQICDYLVPRLSSLDAPLLAVIGGSTGSGKSTLVNTLAGEEVSPAGVLRPTTRSPVLVCHRDDVGWFLDDRLLPGLPRLTGERPATGAVLHLRPVQTLRPGVALLDAPDIDSVEEANRDLATQLLAAADLWLFVTTAVRYADAVPWEFLARARDRGTSLAVVVNRIPPGAEDEITADLERLLEGAGLADIPLFAVLSHELTEGRLPAGAVAPVSRLLEDLATDTERRMQVVRQTLDGALASVTPRARLLLAASEAQQAARQQLLDDVDSSYGRAADVVAEGLESGAMLRTEVLERWQELIGTGELMRAVQGRLTRVRDRATAWLTGRGTATDEVAGEITSRLEQLLVDVADRAALETAVAWRTRAGGPALLGDEPASERASDRFRQQVGPEIRAWQDAVLDLVRARGQGKRTTARVLALGVNSVGVALIIVLFSSTGGLTGGEVAIASGTATLSQALLTALFGEQAVRDLANDARRDLLERVDVLLGLDADRFRQRLASVAPEELTGELRQRIADFERARQATGRGR